MSFIWIRHLFRPTIQEVTVNVYEGTKLRDISTYDSHRLIALIESINTLWKVSDNSPYWFETDLLEERHCFKRSRQSLVVTCYREDMMSNGFKTKTGIPIRYRKKMFDTYHPIRPQMVGSMAWPQDMTVKFVVDK